MIATTDAAVLPGDAVAKLEANFWPVWNAVKPPGPLWFGRLAGSRAFNVADANSDWDWAGVYVTPARELLSLDVPADTLTGSKGVVSPADWTFHDVGKFLAVLLKGNANALDSLFAPESTIVRGDPSLSAHLWELRSNRKLFLTKTVVAHYLAYARGQLRRMGEYQAYERAEDKTARWKDVSHGVRLLHEAHRVVRGEEPLVRWPDDSPERQLFLDVRHQRVAYKELVKVTDSLAQLVEFGISRMPDAVPRAFCNDLLLRIRLPA